MSALLLGLALLQAQSGSAAAPPVEQRPFDVGESFQYSAKLGFVRLGTGNISVAGIDTVRGVPSYVFRFQLEGGLPIYRLNSVLESRTGIADFKSRQFVQDSDENGKVRIRRYDIFPDSGFYRQEGQDTTFPTPSRPLDDAAFLYFVRTLPLASGRKYELDYYFKDDRNPLIIKVEKMERMELPDGSKVDCYVIHPVIGERGIFAPRNDARVWITADQRRIPVQIRSRYPFGTVMLRLEKMTLAATGGGPIRGDP